MTTSEDVDDRARAAAIDAGVRAEAVTIGWMILEAAAAIGAGMIAHSVLLTAFGADSVIELLSGGVLLWRLRSEGRHANVEAVERRAGWISAALLALLCVYVLVFVVLGLLRHVEPESSPIGIAVSSAAIVVMPLLARWKRQINVTLRSAALRADIAETTACAYMAVCVVLGLVLNIVMGWWWIEYVATLVLLIWLIHETKEALDGAHGGEFR